MPTRPYRPCRIIDCPELTRDERGYCAKHDKEVQKKRFKAIRRDPWVVKQLNSKKWRDLCVTLKARQYGMCQVCDKTDLSKGGLQIDHIIPHRGDRAKFWDINNLQVLCKSCHNKKTGRGL